MRHVNWRRREVLVEMLRTALGSRGSYKEEIVIDFTSKLGVSQRCQTPPFWTLESFEWKLKTTRKLWLVVINSQRRLLITQRDSHQERCKETWLIKKMSASGLIDFFSHKNTDKWLNQPALSAELKYPHYNPDSERVGMLCKMKKIKNKKWNAVICFCNIPSRLLSLCQLVCNVLVASKFRLSTYSEQSIKLMG